MRWRKEITIDKGKKEEKQKKVGKRIKKQKQEGNKRRRRSKRQNKRIKRKIRRIKSRANWIKINGRNKKNE